jgi:uncharacterized membrane protein YgcG
MKYLSNPLAHAILLAALFLVTDVAFARDHTRGYTYNELGMVEVINPARQWAWVNIDFEMMTIDIGVDIPTFIIPTGNIIIEVTDANARMTSYVIDVDIPNQLSVGTGIGPGYNPEGGSDVSGSADDQSGGGSGGGGDSGDYWDYSDAWDAWDAWEGGYGGLTRSCYGDVTDPYNTIIVCSR